MQGLKLAALVPVIDVCPLVPCLTLLGEQTGKAGWALGHSVVTPTSPPAHLHWACTYALRHHDTRTGTAVAASLKLPGPKYTLLHAPHCYPAS